MRDYNCHFSKNIFEFTRFFKILYYGLHRHQTCIHRYLKLVVSWQAVEAKAPSSTEAKTRGVKKAKSVSPKKATVSKAALKTSAKSAKASKEVNKKIVSKAAEKKSKAVKEDDEESSSSRPKRGASKTVTKEPAAAKTVKAPKPKMSPVKAKKAKATKIPKVASPTKAPKSKKSVGSKSQKAAPSQSEESASSISGEEEAVPPAKSRKRTKPVKEVAVKKPKGINWPNALFLVLFTNSFQHSSWNCYPSASPKRSGCCFSNRARRRWTTRVRSRCSGENQTSFSSKS